MVDKGELFYVDKDGKKQDASLHEGILFDGDNATALAIGIKVARKAGLKQASIDRLYGKDDRINRDGPARKQAPNNLDVFKLRLRLSAFQIKKFNPNHDEKGRFASAGGGPGVDDAALFLSSPAARDALSSVAKNPVVQSAISAGISSLIGQMSNVDDSIVEGYVSAVVANIETVARVTVDQYFDEYIDRGKARAALKAGVDKLISVRKRVLGKAMGEDEEDKVLAGLLRLQRLLANDDFAKFNTNHDEKGRFSEGDGSGGGSTETFSQSKPEQFIAARDKSTRLGFLSPATVGDLVDHKLLLSSDGKVGAAVDKDGDIQNVFNNGGPKGAAAKAVVAAIEAGGRTLDCYDGYLPAYYRQFGFEETSRMKFNPEFAPANLDAAKRSPDVVFMAWNGYLQGGRAGAVKRASSRTEWVKNNPSKEYTDDWDKAKAASRRAFSKRGRAGDYRLVGKEQRSENDREGNRLGFGAGPRSGRALTRAESILLLKTKLNKFNPNHDEKGRFATGDGGGSSKEKHDAWLKLDEARAAATQTIINKVSEDLSFDASRISTTFENRTFVLNDKVCTYAGSFDHSNGRIQVYLNQVDQHTAAGVVAHEIEHAVFQGVLDAVRAEGDRLRLDPGPPPDPNGQYFWQRRGGDSSIMMLDGRLRSPYDEKYPLIAEMHEVFNQYSIDEFADSDGVSDYSAEYWKAWRDGKMPTDRAVHETLAEMARIKYETGAFPKHRWTTPLPSPLNHTTPTMARQKAEFAAGTKRWQTFFKTIDKLYKGLRKK